MGHCQSTLELHLMNSRSGIGDGQSGGWMVGWMASTNSISFTYQASQERDGRREDVGGPRGDFSPGPCQYDPALYCRGENDIVADWNMIQGTDGIWLWHTSQGRGQRWINSELSGVRRAVGRSVLRMDTVRERWAHNKISQSPLRFVLPLERANLISLTQVVQKKKENSEQGGIWGAWGERVPKIDCSNTTRLCIFNARSSFSSWEMHQFIFPFSPSFHLFISVVSW